MATTAIPNSNGHVFSDQELIIEYNKLIRFRDDVVANRTQPSKLPRESSSLGVPASTTGALQATSLSKAANGYYKPSQANNTTPKQTSALQVPKPPSNPSLAKTSNIQKLPTPTSGASGIDPIFLQKSDVLVRAEAQQARQRLEHALEQQVQQKKRQKAFDQEALPDFDVTDVFRKAQELVKPLKIHEKGRANRITSSTDSFDEKTFYSSQMNESTTTEEADESPKWRPRRICNFFKRGECCRYGDACTFSHDPAMKARLEGDGSQAMDIDSVNADEQTSPRQDDKPAQRVPINGTTRQPPTQEVPATVHTAQSEAERRLQERVTQLEAELRNSRAAKERPPSASARQEVREPHELQEEPAYSPPPPDEFGRDVGLREPERRRPTIQQPSSISGQPVREYGRRIENPPSPLPNNVRVIRNHITSPVAPQPARVSPLAMAKVPQVSQIQGESRRSSRGSNIGIISAGQSPNATAQASGSKKRRRGLDSGEQMRNVVPRRDLSSPGVRIKDEPVSPPPFANGDLNLRRVDQRPEASRRLYVDTTGLQCRDQEQVFQQPRIIERSAYGHVIDDRGPLTPMTRRVVSRNGQHYYANEEPDLRRIVSARQVRPPMSSPPPYAVQYSASQPRAVRAASQVYFSPTGRGVSQHDRASAQLQPAPYSNEDRSPSPPLPRAPQSPNGRHSIAMAPPPRRIIVDQWGNRFMEAPVPVERQVSVAPVMRGTEYDARYEQVSPRNGSVRQRQLVSVDEGQYIRKGASPAFLEYPAPSRIRQVIGPRGDIYEEEQYVTRNEGPQIAEYSDHRPAGRYEEVPAPQEKIVRMRSVRPVERQYEMPREQIARLQSVRPQPRIVSLGERPEQRSQVIRPISVRPEIGSSRQMSYAVDDRPRYQYASQGQERGYVEEIQDEGGLHEAAGSGGRRIIQLL
ncbi:hypothetical protein N7G274_006774 [Stereocaulon virgatum]|uniref:C3H1-type domain-containing protein n=1 Tax=Stereocaulon virgatum TaxID=373712 RepID=A0ABR4A4P8_9LECA